MPPLHFCLFLFTSPLRAADIINVSRVEHLGPPNQAPRLPLFNETTKGEKWILDTFLESTNAEKNFHFLRDVKARRDATNARLDVLKQELFDVRTTMAVQLGEYEEELMELRRAFDGEVDRLTDEFSLIRESLKDQMDKIAHVDVLAKSVQGLQEERDPTGARKRSSSGGQVGWVPGAGSLPATPAVAPATNIDS